MGARVGEGSDPGRQAAERQAELAERVLELARGLVLADNHFLADALGMLRTEHAPLAAPLATDGARLIVDDGRLLAAFARTGMAPTHDYAHVLVHGILAHPFVGKDVEADAWDLASDIVAEYLVRDLLGPRPGTRGEDQARVFRQLEGELGGRLTTERLYRALASASPAQAQERRPWAALFHACDHALWHPEPDTSETGGPGGTEGSSTDGPEGGPAAGGMTPAAGAEVGTPDRTGHKDATSPSKAPRLDHDGGKGPSGDGKWSGDGGNPNDGKGSGDAPPGRAPADAASPPRPGPDDRGAKGLARLPDAVLQDAESAWRKQSQQMRVDLETLSRKRGDRLGHLMAELEVGAHERTDYQEFLRQFAIRQEQLHASEDEFDYVLYTYGLELFGDLPLIEPVEYRDETRVRDFVIVLDTSSSVTSRTVQHFVDATFDVLSSEASFTGTTNIHIIQCDTAVRSDVKLTSLADLDRWRRSIKLYGFGGTDFRPAFRYVDELIMRGEFEDLSGLIYFTDGWGVYPERMPPYRCAFVFYDEDHRPDLVPAWAIQLVMHPGEFESLSVY